MQQPIYKSFAFRYIAFTTAMVLAAIAAYIAGTNSKLPNGAMPFGGNMGFSGIIVEIVNHTPLPNATIKIYDLSCENMEKSFRIDAKGGYSAVLGAYFPKLKDILQVSDSGYITRGKLMFDESVNDLNGKRNVNFELEPATPTSTDILEVTLKDSIDLGPYAVELVDENNEVQGVTLNQPVRLTLNMDNMAHHIVVTDRNYTKSEFDFHLEREAWPSPNFISTTIIPSQH